MSNADDKWYYNLETKEVVQGKQIGWTDRMGPYDTREEAEHALQIAHERNEQADAYDEQDESWDS
ncbi:hypothetical protein ACFPVT_07775 [Corynebacterium choanae]|uniref:SPOR domain-containing protein n=1 Tax=Corynebacterium choanae TaxID=1862358 RepID=A0A3G6J7H5_9CORY|nr:hypothetical protein [Corynebacterium choanae]AZA14007.1 hypothetical protein CCHOA_08075 [Corynebacterium choanae]